MSEEPGVLGTEGMGVMWRSYLSGVTQVGRGAILSFENTVEKEILISGNPNGNGGHQVIWRKPSGLAVVFDWDGSDYSTSDCSVKETLTTTGSGAYLLTGKYDDTMLFDANGMPDLYTDRNGNTVNPTYNGSLQLTGYAGTRGKNAAVAQDGDGFLAYFENAAGARWTMDYDGSGNLVEVGVPATTDQSSGSTIALTYDGSNRLIEVESARGQTVYEIEYVGSTPQVAKVTINGEDTTFAYYTGRTEITDAVGTVRRVHYTGQNITQTDYWVSGQAKYIHTYTYSGALVVTHRMPRGNRVDFTYNGADDLLEKRQKETNTSSSSSSDIVEAWAYSGAFVASYTDPLGEETTFTRNGAGSVTRVDFPDVTSPGSQSAYRTFSYNARGQITGVVDEEGQETELSYYGAGDDFALLEEIVVDPSGLALTTSLAYSDEWNVSTVTNPRSLSTTYVWDALRRLKQVTSPSPLSIDQKWEYDAHGNPTKFELENLDEDGASVSANPWITTTRTFTPLDAVATVVEEMDVSTTRTTTFAYDALGRLQRVTLPEGNKEKWEYEERGLLSKHIRGETSGVESDEEFFYDTNGNLVTLRDARNNDTTVTYDLFDRRTKVTDALSHYVELTLDKAGQVTEEARKNSSNTTLARRTYYYDERGRLWKTSDLRKDPGTTYSDAVTTIERFKTGHVKKVTDARSKDTTYDYDAAWRRISVLDPWETRRSSRWTRRGTRRPGALRR